MKNNLPRFATCSALLSILLAIASSRNDIPRRHLTPHRDAWPLLSIHEQSIWQRQFQAARRHVSRKRRLQNGDDNNECMSPLQRWFVTNIESIPSSTWEAVEQYNITTLAYLYKHYVQNHDGTSEYFGAYGERTNEMKENHAGLTAFWTHRDDDTKRYVHGRFEEDTQEYSTFMTTTQQEEQSSIYPTTSNKQSDVILLGMHGEDLSDAQTLIPTLQQIYSLEPSEATSLAYEIQSIIEEMPGKYTNPLLTSNAMATQTTRNNNDNYNSQERDSIIVGDGVFTFLEWLNLSTNGPIYIHSHEYAHHIQYDIEGREQQQLSSSSQNDHAERTRRLELMADVFGSYYSAHANGGKYNAGQLYEIHRSAFSLGDCESRHGTHHGTPRQRECASNYGANLAMPSYVDGGYQIRPEQLMTMFDEEYERLLTMNEELCTLVVEESTLDETIYGENFEKADVPFYGDDGFIDSSVGDLALSYLEPIVSWFDPKPATYYDTEQSSFETQFEPESIPEESYFEHYESYEPYESYQTFDNNFQGNSDWSIQTPFVGDELESPTDTIEKHDTLDEELDRGDDWFEQTNWYSGQTSSISAGCFKQRAANLFRITIMAVAILLSSRF